jgi:hypothetical protein
MVYSRTMRNTIIHERSSTADKNDCPVEKSAMDAGLRQFFGDKTPNF